MRFSERELQRNTDGHRMYDDPRRTLIYIDRKSMVDNLDAIESEKSQTERGSLHYMILVDNVFRHEMRPLETQVPLTSLRKVMIYWRLQTNFDRCTW